MTKITMRLWPALAVLGCACVHTPPVAKAVALPSTPKVPHSAAAERYLAAVEAQLDVPWNRGVRDVASSALPRSHRLNDAALTVTLEARVGAKGAQLRVRRPSGWHPFDNTAMRIFSRVQWPQPPTALDGKELTVRWRFFRDARGCSRAYATLNERPLSDADALALALSRRSRQRALTLAGGTTGRSATRELLVQRGLADPRLAVRSLALRLADQDVLMRTAGDATAPRPLWQVALQELRRRGHAHALIGALRRMSRPRYDWRPAPRPEQEQRDRRLTTMLSLAASQQLEVPSIVVARALARKQPALVRTVLPFARQLSPLWTALRHRKWTPGVAAALLRALASDGTAPPRLRRQVLRRLRQALLAPQGRLRRELLVALARWPRPELRPALDTSCGRRGADAPACLRARAALGGDPRFLYRALLSSTAALRLAAIEALGRFPGAGLAASYRLGKQAYEAPEPFRSAAIVAMVRIGHPRMEKDIAYLVGRLPAPSKRLLAQRLTKLGGHARYLGLLSRYAPPPRPKPTARSGSARDRERDIERLVTALTTPVPPPSGHPVATR